MTICWQKVRGLHRAAIEIMLPATTSISITVLDALNTLQKLISPQKIDRQIPPANCVPKLPLIALHIEGRSSSGKGVLRQCHNEDLSHEM